MLTTDIPLLIAALLAGFATGYLTQYRAEGVSGRDKNIGTIRYDNP